MKKLLLLCIGAVMSMSAVAQIDFNAEYYIRNSANGQYLTNGFSWGTMLVLKETGRAFKIEVDGTEFKIKSSVGYIKDVGSEIFADADNGGASKFTFKPVEGKYVAMCGGRYIAQGKVVEYQNPDDWHYQWFMAENDVTLLKWVTDESEAIKWELLSTADMKAAMDNATVTAPVDATFYLKGHNVEINDPENDQAWVYVKNGNVSGHTYPDKSWQWYTEQGPDGWCSRSTCIWCVNEEGAVEGTDVLRQEVEGAKPGLYEARYRITNQYNTPLVVRLNDTEAKAYEGTENDMWYLGMFEELHKNELKAQFTVAEDGKLSIKMEKTIDPAQQNRFAFKSMRLSYLGDDTTGIDAVSADNENAPVEYYNLQGMRVENPANGLYIKRQGSKTVKVLVK